MHQQHANDMGHQGRAMIVTHQHVPLQDCLHTTQHPRKLNGSTEPQGNHLAGVNTSREYIFLPLPGLHTSTA
jgi:hypothetical protein